jgi:hypothetical protein
MKLTDKYTTKELIAADKEAVEIKKISISSDTFAVCEMIDKLTKTLEKKL